MVTLVKPQAKMAAALVKMRQQHHEKLIDVYINDCAKWIEERAKGTLYKKTREIAESISRNRRTVVPSCHSAGKALDLGTWLPTPDGWITMRDIEVGDKLFDEEGRVCSVVAVSEIEERNCYKVTFSDGTNIVAADNHQWSVIDFYSRPRKILDWRNFWNHTKVVTTEFLANNLQTNLGQLRWKLPINMSINTNINWGWRWEPYTYGCWLGDGTTVRWELTCHKDDSEHFASMTNGRIIDIPQRSNISIIKLPGRNTLDCPTRVFGIDRKILPIEMLRTSRENRLDLLRGLMDTDGTIDLGRKTVEIDLSNKELAYTVVELIRTLGWKVGISSRETTGSISYRINFTPSENPFYLQRKAIRWELADIIGSRSSRVTQKSIESVEYVGKKLVKCVEVDSPRSLYLAGDGFTPTHNSWLSARIAAWWIDSHPPGSAFVVTTAPTNKQIRAVLWKELRRVYVTANLQGRLNQTEWWLNNEMVAMGRKPSDYDPTAFNGVHAKYVLVIIDEGGGVPENIFIAANSLVSNEFGRMFVVGNPDDSGTHFERICKPDSGWVVIPISAYDTPNFTGEYVPQDVKDVLISQIYVDELRRDVGEDSAVFQSKVLAKFPSGKNDGVIPYHFIIQCMDQNEEYSEEDLLPIEMGVDVGAGGDDTSIRIRYGMLVGPGGSLKTPKPEEAFAFILENVIRHNVSRVKIDIIGLGWGLLGMLDSARMRGKHYNEILDEEIDVSHVEFIGVNVGQRATDPERFPRLRDQLWWEVGRELSRTKGWDLTGLDDKTIGQLTDPTWKPDLAGRHKVESKQDTIKRTGRSSPNEADALLLAYCVPPMPETEELAVYYDPVEVGPNI